MLVHPTPASSFFTSCSRLDLKVVLQVAPHIHVVVVAAEAPLPVFVFPSFALIRDVLQVHGVVARDLTHVQATTAAACPHTTGHGANVFVLVHILSKVVGHKESNIVGALLAQVSGLDLVDDVAVVLRVCRVLRHAVGASDGAKVSSDALCSNSDLELAEGLRRINLLD